MVGASGLHDGTAAVGAAAGGPIALPVAATASATVVTSPAVLGAGPLCSPAAVTSIMDGIVHFCARAAAILAGCVHGCPACRRWDRRRFSNVQFESHRAPSPLTCPYVLEFLQRMQQPTHTPRALRALASRHSPPAAGTRSRCKRVAPSRHMTNNASKQLPRPREQVSSTRNHPCFSTCSVAPLQCASAQRWAAAWQSVWCKVTNCFTAHRDCVATTCPLLHVQRRFCSRAARSCRTPAVGATRATAAASGPRRWAG